LHCTAWSALYSSTVSSNDNDCSFHDRDVITYNQQMEQT
jgi:hypothetical protein